MNMTLTKWVRLDCGHIAIVDPITGTDGCPTCRKYEMKDERDRHPWQSRRPPFRPNNPNA